MPSCNPNHPTVGMEIVFGKFNQQTGGLDMFPATVTAIVSGNTVSLNYVQNGNTYSASPVLHSSCPDDYRWGCDGENCGGGGGGGGGSWPTAWARLSDMRLKRPV